MWDFFIVGATLAVALNVSSAELYDGSAQPKVCHPERKELESRDLGTGMTYMVKLVRRSFDSLRSLRMTNLVDRAAESPLRCQYAWGDRKGSPLHIIDGCGDTLYNEKKFHNQEEPT